MLKKLEYIAVVPKDDFNRYTAYFFSRDSRVLLPIEFETKNIDYILKDSWEATSPKYNIVKSTKAIISALNGKLSSINILNESQAYVDVVTTEGNAEVICNIFDAIALGFGESIKYFCDADYLKQRGLKITKKVIDSFVLS